MTASTLAEAFQHALGRHPDRVAVRSLDGEHGLTWLEYGRAVERAAGALSALGVRRGDRVALLSRNRPELLVAELAAMHLGANAVALYPTAPPAAIAAIVARVQAKLLLTEQDLTAQATAAAATTLPLDGPDSALAQDAPSRFSFADAWQRVRPDDPAAILFTSGTTGVPKGVVWSHGGALGWAQEFQRCSCEPERVHDLSLAPFASAAERAGGHWRSLIHAGTRTCCPEPARLPEALRAARPTFLFGSPRLWQGVLRYLEAMTGPSRLADAGLDRMSWAITAGAPCPIDTRRRLIELGVPLAELYGMTETGGATITGSGTEDLGTVGRPMPGWQLRISERDEVEIKPAHPATGYLSGSQEHVFRADGWVRTGDLGRIDRAGRLHVTGRIKEVLVPLHGHNISPAALEAELTAACPAITHAFVIGDGRPHLAAIIAVDPSAESPTSLIDAAIEQVNAAREPREHIESYLVIAEEWKVGRELTSTLKLRRDQIAKRYATEIERLYPNQTGPDPRAAATGSGPDGTDPLAPMRSRDDEVFRHAGGS